MKYKKKLIEDSLPLESINAAAAHEKGNPFLKGHPRNLHQWWARRPHGAARALLFAQMVDDPSAHSDIFLTEKAQEKERKRLFKIVEQLSKWENSNDKALFEAANNEIWQSWRNTCAQYADHLEADKLFNRNSLPVFLDPFAGGGTIPLEAQRLGLESYASDLNPVAVTINKALIEVPSIFRDVNPINPEAQQHKKQMAQEWHGAQGIAEDIRYYGKVIQSLAAKSLSSLYPPILVTKELAVKHPVLNPYVGKNLEVLAWLWARTVQCSNPACSKETPLVSSYVLSGKKGKEKYLSPKIIAEKVCFDVIDKPDRPLEDLKKGLKRGMSGIFECAHCQTITTRDYVAKYATEIGLGAQQTAVVVDSPGGRVYLPADVSFVPEIEVGDIEGLDSTLSPNPRDVWCRNFGLLKPFDLFTKRQLKALDTFGRLISQVHDQVVEDGLRASLKSGVSLEGGGNGAIAYADAIALYLALCIDKLADYNNSLCTWNPTNENIGHLFSKQTIPMAWDFPEISPLNGGLSFEAISNGIAKTVESLPAKPNGHASQQDCSSLNVDYRPVVSTDPPYYDNISYADISDFFYAWLRKALKSYFPLLLSTMSVPKSEELVATSYRHGGKEQAEKFFLDGMSEAMRRISEIAHPAFPVTIYYAFKQGEKDGKDGTTNTGWETFLAAVIEAGFAITGTWPIRTERSARSVGIGTNALASSIVLVCRRKDENAIDITLREFITELKRDLPNSLLHMQSGNIAPVDLAQAAIGPGMSIFTKFNKVIDSEGSPLTIRSALSLINQVLDESLAHQEGDFDNETKWALTWFEQNSFDESDYGAAEQLSKAKNTAVDKLSAIGILSAKAGKVKLLKPSEYSEDWDGSNKEEFSAWKVLHQLIRLLESGGDSAAADAVHAIGSSAEQARELAYRLFSLSERKKRSREAMSYNGIVQSWTEIIRLSQERSADTQSGKQDLFDQE